MPISQLRTANVPNTSLSDNSTPDALAGRAGEAIATQLHGKYYTQAYRGNVFTATTAAAGVIIPIFTGLTGTTYTVGLWNPAGSLKNIVPIKMYLGEVAGSGVTVASNFVWAVSPVNVGNSIGVPISTFVSITPVNNYLGSGATPVGRFAGSTTGIVLSAAAAPTTYLKTTGISQFVQTVGGTAQTQWTSVEEFDGTLVLGQGTLLLLATNVAPGAGAPVFVASMTWEEVPV